MSELEEITVEDAEEVTTEESEPVEIENADGDVDPENEEESDESGELVVTLEGVDPEEDDTPVIRKMRQALREKDRELKAVKADREAEKAVEVGEKPKLEDYEFDAEAFETALLDWSERKSQAEAAQEDARKKAADLERNYEVKLQGYHTRKAALNVKDFDEIEDAVRGSLSPVQQSIVVANSPDAAITIYALGKNPKKMDELSKLDPVAFAYNLAKLETQMKVSNKTKPAPEKRTNGGSVPVPSTGDKELERLREEAAKTGDMSKVIAYKRKLKNS